MSKVLSNELIALQNKIKELIDYCNDNYGLCPCRNFDKKDIFNCQDCKVSVLRRTQFCDKFQVMEKAVNLNDKYIYDYIK